MRSTLNSTAQIFHSVRRTPIYRNRSNQRISGPRQVRLVKDIISRREKELVMLVEGIKEEKAGASRNANSISRLEVGMATGKSSLDSLKSSIRHLVDLKGKLDENSDDPNPHSEDDEQLLYSTESVAVQISNKKKEASTYTSRIEESERELYAKRFIQTIWITHIIDMENTILRLEKTLERLKSAFSVLSAMPAEVLGDIFRLRVEEDFEEYVRTPSNTPMHFTALVLSQVCSSWRAIAQTEPSLWRYFSCHPANMALRSQLELFTLFKARNPSTVIACNLSEIAGRHVGRSRFGTVPVTMPPSSPDVIHLMLNGIDPEAIEELPFREHKVLRLQIIYPPNVGILGEIVANFSKASCMEVKSLHPMSNENNPHILFRNNPPLHTLRLDLTRLLDFNIHHIIGSSLMDLQVWHNGTDNIFGAITSQAPHLATIGVTPPNLSFVRSATLHNLTKIILYGPKDHTMPVLSLVDFSQAEYFGRAKELEIRNWPLYTPEGTAEWSIMPVVLEIREKMRNIETIRVMDSYVLGECLVGLVKSLTDTSSNPNGSKLNRVVIDCCSGITRRDCESIASDLEIFEVYV